MSLADLENGLTLVRESSRAHFVGARPESLVHSAEIALGLTFPPTYRKFVSQLGCGSIQGQEFYGVINDHFASSTVPNGIWVTLNERKYPSTPHEMIIIGDSGYGSFYVLDTARRTPDGECPVVEWWPGSGDDPADCKVIAEDFGAFFLMLVQEALETEGQ